MSVALAATLLVSMVGTAAAAPTATKTACKQTSGEPILLSTILPLSGPALNPEPLKAVQAAVKGVNCEGGVQGRPLESLPCDANQYVDPNLGPNCAREAVEKGVVASVARVTNDNSVVEIFASAGIPAVDLGNTPLRSLTSTASFPLTPGTVGLLAGLAAKLYDDGARNIRVVVIDTPQSAAIAGFADRGLEPRGAKVLPPVFYPADLSTDTSAVVQQAINGADAIELVLSKEQTAKIVPEIRAAGFKGPLATPATIVDADTKEAKDKNMIFAGGLYPATSTDQPGIVKFNRDMDRFAPKAKRTDGSVAAWEAVRLVADSLEKAPTIDGPALQKQLELATVAYGVAPEFCYCDGGGVYGIPRVFTPYVLIQKVKNGKYVADGDFFDPTAPPTTKAKTKTN